MPHSHVCFWGQLPTYRRLLTNNYLLGYPSVWKIKTTRYREFIWTSKRDNLQESVHDSDGAIDVDWLSEIDFVFPGVFCKVLLQHRVAESSEKPEIQFCFGWYTRYFFKWAVLGLILSFIFGHFKQTLQFLTTIYCGKFFIQYPVLGFEPTISWMWVSSRNH